MKVLQTIHSTPTQDGAGVKISRIADFSGKLLDPYLMIDEIKSDNDSDYIGGFPPHPHRGIETFTYMISGGFEHQDQLGNKQIIRSGDVQWMSTGYGVSHSEMPVVDDNNKMHGFQIWLNMPAQDKLRPAKYLDSANTQLPQLSNETGGVLRALAGNWQLNGNTAVSPFQELAGNGAIADIQLESMGKIKLDLKAHQHAFIYIHTGSIQNSRYKAGQLLVIDSQQAVEISAQNEGAGMLILAGQPINEKIAHMGPFVMNTQAELK